MNAPLSHPRTNAGWRACPRCALCQSRSLITLLSCPPSPVVRRLPDAEPGAAAPRFPLDLARCADCGHVQLAGVVEPAFGCALRRPRLDADAAAVDAAERFARALIDRYQPASDALIVEIGSNDGAFLARFDEVGLRAQGVEPAVNVAAIAVERGIRTFPGFFTPAVAERIEEERGRAALIVARRAFAETEDLAGFMEGVSALLSRDGALVLEVPALFDLLDRGGFDSIQHDLLHYCALAPLSRFFAANDFEVVAAERSKVDRGSLRIHCQRLGGAMPPSPSVEATLAREAAAGLADAEPLARLSRRAEAIRKEVAVRLRGARATGARIAGWGVTPDSLALLNALALDEGAIDVLIDDSVQPATFSPIGVPIAGPGSLLKDRPTWVLALDWDRIDAIVERCADLRARGGRVLAPLPCVSVV